MWIKSTHLLLVQFFSPTSSNFLHVSIIPLLNSASHNFWFWSPILGWRVLNFQSEDRYNLRKATAGRTLDPRDFPIDRVGIFHAGFFFPRCSNFLVLLLHHLPRFVHLVWKVRILYVAVQPSSLGVLQLISPCSSHFLLVSCVICGYFLSLILLSDIDVILL